MQAKLIDMVNGVRDPMKVRINDRKSEDRSGFAAAFNLQIPTEE